MSDGDLVHQTLHGQPSAYEELVRRWAARITACCQARVRRRDAAEDLAQETLLRGYRSLSTLAEPEKFGAWLRGIAVRVCLDWLKARSRSEVSLNRLDDDGHADALLADERSPGEADVDHQDELSRLMSEVDDLPEEYREVILLYYYRDQTYQELAELLEVSTATINARLTKARAQLREKLSPARRI